MKAGVTFYSFSMTYRPAFEGMKVRGRPAAKGNAVGFAQAGELVTVILTLTASGRTTSAARGDQLNNVAFSAVKRNTA
jgi:hypothetical protein